MASSSATSLLPFVLLLLTSAAASETPTAYQVLEEYDLLVGLLPKGVTSYTLNENTGEFNVELGDTCKFSVEGYDLRYKSEISGVISKDRIRKLRGVSVKVLLFWVDIVEVSRDGDGIDLSVGIVSAGFDVSNFEESPECGCGFDCNGLEEKRRRRVLRLRDWSV